MASKPSCQTHKDHDSELSLTLDSTTDNPSTKHLPTLDQLSEQESIWRDRYSFFLSRGFALRPRYQPDWTPSWIGTALSHWDCEDAIRAFVRSPSFQPSFVHQRLLYVQYPKLLDAKNVNDGKFVCIKMITKKSDEINIARYLSPPVSNPPLDSKNHSVPVLDSFRDPTSPDIDYLVMPLLREFNDPEFLFIGEVVDFVTQILDGMEFMHRKLVAHADLTSVNIMMDALPIFPRGWHFVHNSFAPNGKDVLKPRARIDYPVRYYIIDYDCSVRFLPGQSPIIRGLGGRDNDPPELTGREPFDHFKLDVFTVGNVFLKEFRQKFLGLEFLDSLIEVMMIRDFHKRRTALMALQHWYKLKAILNVATARWRLRKPDENVGDRVFHTVADGITGLKALF